MDCLLLQKASTALLLLKKYSAASIVCSWSQVFPFSLQCYCTQEVCYTYVRATSRDYCIVSPSKAQFQEAVVPVNAQDVSRRFGV